MTKKIIATLFLILGIALFNPVFTKAEWRQSNIGWWYKEKSIYSTGWRKIDNKLYYFNDDGYVETGWINNRSKWYYLTSDGSMAHDTIVDNCFVDSNGAWVENNPWKNKKYNALGDSITKGIDPSNSYQIMLGNRYTDIMQRCLKLSTANNYGVESSTIVHQSNNNGMIDRYKFMSDDADLISVFGGINDFIANVPMGTINSGNNNEFKCAFNNLLKGLKAKYPSKKIFVITPIPIQSDTIDGNSPNSNGFTIKDYVNAEIEICKMNGIPVLNLYDGALGITPYNESERTMFMPDGIHPNIEGMNIITKELVKFINKF